MTIVMKNIEANVSNNLIRAIYTRKNKTRLKYDANCTIYTSMSYLIRCVLAKPRLILDEMCRLYGKFLCKTRLFFPRINGPIVFATSLQTLITEPCILTEKAMVPFKRGEPFVNKFCILFGGVTMEIFFSLNLPDHHAPC